MHAQKNETTMHVSSLSRSLSRDRLTARKRRRVRWIAVPIAMGGLTLLAACGPYGGTQTAANAAPATGGAVVATASTQLGKILVNSAGRTIYDFANDTPGMSRCDGACAMDWMPVAAPDALPTSLPGVPAVLGSTKRADGTQQLTVDGRPVYTFEGDSAPGQTNGNGITLNGGLWTAVSPNGSPLGAGAASPTTTGGY
jgi:predicted lipoprotein with Yx(FWY)xxD motif